MGKRVNKKDLEPIPYLVVNLEEATGEVVHASSAREAGEIVFKEGCAGAERPFEYEAKYLIVPVADCFAMSGKASVSVDQIALDEVVGA